MHQSTKQVFCAVVCWFFAAAVAQSTHITIAPASNLPADFDAEIDIVFVYTQSVLNQLPFEQFGWISTRDEQIARFADNIDVLSVAVNASFSPLSLPLPERHADAVAILVFASHEDPVAEGMDISGESPIALRVERWGVAIE